MLFTPSALRVPPIAPASNAGKLLGRAALMSCAHVPVPPNSESDWWAIAPSVIESP